jgi:hypothetical protein
VRAEETRCSANGKQLSGKASHSTPSNATPGQAERGIGRRAEGRNARVAKPTRIRTKVTPLGPIARSPSAMKRKEAPQITPGTTRRSQSAAPVLGLEEEVAFGRERSADGEGSTEDVVRETVQDMSQGGRACC